MAEGDGDQDGARREAAHVVDWDVRVVGCGSEQDGDGVRSVERGDVAPHVAGAQQRQQHGSKAARDVVVGMHARQCAAHYRHHSDDAFSSRPLQNPDGVAFRTKARHGRARGNLRRNIPLCTLAPERSLPAVDKKCYTVLPDYPANGFAQNPRTSVSVELLYP